MNGPIKKARIGLGLDGLEIASVVAGALVVVGLLLESGPEVWHSILNRVVPGRDIVGGALVALGVFGEVAIGIFISRSAKREKAESDSIITTANERIAELNAETERLRKQNNDTALLLAYRSVGDLSAFEEAMRPFGGTTYVLEFIPESNEVAYFQWELNSVLKKAGWFERPWVSHRKNLGFGIHVLAVTTEAKFSRSKAADALADWLDSKQIAVISSLTKNGFFGNGTVLLQIGPKPETIRQYEQIRSEYARLKSFRLVTPPQA